MAGKSDFVLKLGFKIDAKSISKSALRAALNKAAEGAILKITKVQLANPSKIRADISKQIGTIKIDKLTVSAQASKSFAKSINDKVRPQIKGLTVSAASLANLRKSVERALGNIKVQASSAGAASGGRAASGGGSRAGATGRNVSAEKNLESAINQRKAALINAARVEIKALQRMKATEKASLRLAQALRQSGINFNEVGAKVAQVTKRFAEYTLSVKGLQAVQAVIRTATQGIIELDNATRDLAKVGSVGDDISKAFDAISATAIKTGRSVSDAGDAIGEFVRQGKDLATAAKFAADALKLTNISNLNAASSARLVTAAQQVFGITTDELGTKLSTLAVFADSSATNVTEIGTAFLRTASSAGAAGFSIEETFALLAATLEQTRLNASTVGTAFKTITARLGRDRGKVAQSANEMLNLSEGTASYLTAATPIPEFLGVLAKSWEKLNSDQKNSIAYQVAGVRQANVLIGTLDNYKKSQELLGNTQENGNALTRKNAEELKKLSTRAKQAGVAIKTAAGALAGLQQGEQGGVANIFGSSLDSFTTLVTTFPDAISGLNSLNEGGVKLGDTLSTGLVGAMAGAIGAIIPAMLNGLKQMLGLVRATGDQVRSTNDSQRDAVSLTKQQVAAQRELNQLKRNQGAVGRAGSFVKDGFNQVVLGKSGNQSKEPNGKSIAARAAFGAAVFAMSDVMNQLTADLEEDSFGAAISDATTQAATMAIYLGPMGALLGGLTSSLKSAITALKNFNEKLSEIHIGNLATNIEAFSKSIQFDARDAARQAAVGVLRINEAIVKEIENGKISNDFSIAINESVRSLKDSLRQSFLELEGLPSAAAGILAQIESGSKELEGLIVRTKSGEFFTGEDGIDVIARGDNTAVEVTTERTKELSAQMKFAKDELLLHTQYVDSASRAVNEFAFALERAGDLAKEGADVEEVAAELSESSKGLAKLIEGTGGDVGNRAVNAIRDELVKTIGLQDFVGGRAATSEAKAKTSDERASALEIASGKVREQIEKDRAVFEEQTSKLRENIGKQAALIEKEDKRVLEVAKSQKVARENIVELLKETALRSDLAVASIKKENSAAFERLDTEAKISELKRGTLQQQIQAVIEEKKLGLAQDSNLANIDKEIGLRKSQGQDTGELDGKRKDALKALDERALAESKEGIRKVAEEDLEKRRAEALDNVEGALKKTTETEKDRVKALSALQKANKKTIDLQKKAVEASENVKGAVQSVSNAQAALSDANRKAAETIRSSVRSALESGGFSVAIGAISAGLNGVLSQEQKLNVIRKEGLEQSLKIAQDQAKTLFSIGERIATGGPGSRLDAQRGIQTAQAITGGESISSFTPEDLKLALAVENLFPGLKEAISTQALATVGLDDELGALRSKIVQDSTGLATAEVKPEIQNAIDQLNVQRHALQEARKLEKIAQDDLSLSKLGNVSNQANLDAARASVGVSIRELEEAQRQSKKLENVVASVDKVAAAVRSIPKVGRSEESRFEGPDYFSVNAARGTLSGPEMRGLEAAALREKSLMPAGSKLMLANTSETVLTRKQSRLVGFNPRSQANAAGGNADVSGLAALMEQVVTRLDQLNSSVKSGGVSSVNLQVDTNKNINVKGISGLGQKLESELTNKFASGNDVSAIQSAIMNIISKLGESGLADDLGR